MIVHTAPKEASKDERTTCLRELINKRATYAHETERAEVLLYTLSYQSAILPERHVWVETAPDEITLDLEDWENERDEWDNALYRVTVESPNEAVALLDTWLSGESLHNYRNLNKNYERISTTEQSDLLNPVERMPLYAYAE